MENESLEQQALTFKALSEPARLFILKELLVNPEISLAQISEKLNISISAVHKHLRSLISSQIVSQSESGNQKAINFKLITETISWLLQLKNKVEKRFVSEAESKLWSKYKKLKSRALHEELVKKYLFLVKYVSKRIAAGVSENVSFDDLVSFGILGLFDAIETYDVTMGNKFETFAIPRIGKSIRDSLKKISWSGDFIDNNRLVERLESISTKKEIAQTLKMTLNDLNKIQKKLSSVSAEEALWESSNESKISSRIQGLFADSYKELKSEKEIKKIFDKVLELSSDREKLILVLYYYENLTFREIGQVLNVSESRISQIHSNFIRKFRNSLKHTRGAQIESC